MSISQSTTSLLPALEDEHQLQRDLEQGGRQQREGEGLADHRREVLNGEVQDDHIDEHVDHVGRMRDRRERRPRLAAARAGDGSRRRRPARVVLSQG